MDWNLALFQVAAIIQKSCALNKELANLHNTLKRTFRSVKNDGTYP